eukprot:1139743-Pelagomonas_calceolata.AAC.10
MKDCISPKFLKDVRMDVPDAKSDVLRCGPRGDLVVGSDQLQVDSITTKGTVVHWFQLKAADDELAAELCMVLRHSKQKGFQTWHAFVCTHVRACARAVYVQAVRVYVCV